MRKSFFVTIKISDTVPESEIREYIQEAVSGWGGQFDPRSPFFGLYGKVTVKRAGNIKGGRHFKDPKWLADRSDQLADEAPKPLPFWKRWFSRRAGSE